MSKKIIALFSILLLTICLFSCQKQTDDTPDGMKLASSEIADYILYVPSMWTVDMSTGITSAYHSAADPANISVMVASLDSQNMTPAEYWDGYKEQYKTTLPDMQEIDMSNLILDGINAELHTFTATMSGTIYKFRQAIAIKGSNAFILTYTAKEPNFDTHIDDVNNILEQFRFK